MSFRQEVQRITPIYKMRGQLVSAVLMVALIVAIMVGLNHFFGFKKSSQTIHTWLSDDHRWLILLAAVSTLSLVAWNNVSPSLRTIFGKNWVRLTIWGLTGVVTLMLVNFTTFDETLHYRLADLSVVILYIVFLGLVAKLWPPERITLPESPYIEDDPRKTANYQLYESQSKIIGDIRHLIEGAQPSAFAISGRWGVGKTFLLERARSKFLDDKTIIWVDFEPWRYASEEALIRGFYDDIGKKLSKEIPGIQHIARPLMDTTEKFVRKTDNSGLIGTMLDALRAVFKSNTEEAPEQQIEGLLEQEGKRLVVVVDDIERSFNGERIFRALQLAHFAKGIKGVQVIFLCDKDVVLEARPTHFREPIQNAAEYLEKFVEREIVVPTPRPPELRQLFSRLMEAHSDRPGFDFEPDDLPDDMLSAISTPRATIRLFNEYASFRWNIEEGDI